MIDNSQQKPKMEHTYLRYECADSFGLVASTASSKAPTSNAIISFQHRLLFTTAGSYCTAYNLRTGLPVCRLAHRELLSGGVGTGRALNSDEIVCLDTATVSAAEEPSGSGSNLVLLKVATGWVDGAVRVFDLTADDLKLTTKLGLVHSLIHDNPDEDFVQSEPLVLNGHTTSVRTVVFDDARRLASGGNDGSVVLWDVVAEAGLFRLLGHKGGITDIRFFASVVGSFDSLMTSCLDGLIKIWDLERQCCIQTLANHRGEVWGADCRNIQTGDDDVERWRLVTGGSDGRVRLWSVETLKRLAVQEALAEDEPPLPHQQPANNHHQSLDDVCRFMGTVNPPPNVATSSEKVLSVRFHQGKFLGVLRSDSKQVDIYLIKSLKESQKKRQRRLRRKKEKQKKKDQTDEKKSGQKRGILDDPESSDEESAINLDDEGQLDPEMIKASDEFEYLTTVLASHRVRGFVFSPQKEKGQLVRVVCSLATNALETFALVRTKEDSKNPGVIVAEKLGTMDIAGHPTGIRAVALSSDDSLACTVSKNVTKIWNVDTRSCIHSLSPSLLSSKKGSSYGLCAVFLPGNSHVVVGTREGHLFIIDINAGDVVFAQEKAHTGAIWSVDLRRPTSSDSSIALVTGSADNSVKFWIVESEVNEQNDGGADHPVLVHTRTLELKDDVVAVRYSHAMDTSKRMVFVSALDNTIKVFFDDSLKLFLNLYGHTLPALAIESSDDDAILASGGADKTVKIWGLDFGDTHRTMHGHEDSITDLRFVRRTHNFFTASKDGTVRYWDGDRFEQILLLNGHCAEVNCLAVSRTGAYVLSGGMDRQVRVWERTKDIVFLQEERERALEQIFEKVSGRDAAGTASILDRKDDESDNEGAGGEVPQSEAAVQRSVLSVAAGDRLLEGLERTDQELKDVFVWKRANGPDKKKQPNPLLLGLEPAHYVLWLLKTIKSAELEQSLLVLPLTHIERLIYYCTVLLKQGRGIELCAKVSIFLVKVHQNQLAASRSMVPPLRELRRLVRLRLSESRDIVGYNVAALKLVARIAHEKKQSLFPAFEAQSADIWAELGLGSDVAAALEGKSKSRRR